MRRLAGFSLLEVLVALFLFSFLGIASYRFLSVIIRTEEVAGRHSEQERRELRALALIRQDFLQAVPRAVRDESGKPAPAFVAGGDYAVEFTRAGWLNPMLQPRSELQRVAYAVGPRPASDGQGDAGEQPGEATGNYLLRVYWPYPDRAAGSPVAVQALLPDVTELQLRFLDQRGQWIDQWPPATGGGQRQGPSTDLPRAVEFTLRLGDGREQQRLLIMPENP